MTINYCNSFNENYDITINYAPITIYDFNLFITGSQMTIRGKDASVYNNIMVNNDGDGVYSYTPWNDPTADHPTPDVNVDSIFTDAYGNLRFNSNYTGTVV